jgi:hypothetical protein
LWLILPNQLAASVLYPLPSKWSDSQVICDGFNPISQKHNFEDLNACFGSDNTGVGDSGFLCFCKNSDDRALI